MAQASKIRLPSGEVVVPGDWTSSPLWTTVEIGTGSLATLQGFSYGLGGTVPGSPGNRNATPADTNMQGAGSVLPNNEEIHIYSIQVELFRIGTSANNGAGVDITDVTPFPSVSEVLAIQKNVLLVMKIASAGNKEYIRAPLGFFPQGMGVHHYTSGARASATVVYSAASNGSVNIGEHRELATPHRVGPGEAFNISLQFPLGSVPGINHAAPTTDRIRARIFADGIRRRPVA